MARRKQQVEETDLTGTVEGEALDYFEREKREYEKRTGQKVEFVPPTPTTRTPIAPEPVETNDEPAESDDAEVDQPAAEENQPAAEENQSEGDEEL